MQRAEGGVGEGDRGGEGEGAADGGAGNFDFLGARERRSFHHESEGLHAEIPGEETAGAEARGAQRGDVAVAVFEIRGGAGVPVVKDGLGFRGVVGERRGGGAGGAEFGLGEVAAAGAEVGGEVAEDVHELEAFAEIRAEPAQVGEAEVGAVRQVVKAQAGPEFADAAGDEVGVFVEFGGALEGDDAASFAKAGEVEGLAADDFVEHADNLPTLFLVEDGEPGEAVAEAGDERTFAIVRGGDFLAQFVEALGLAGADHLPKGREMFQPRGDGHGGAVGDGVAGAGEQVGEADGAAQHGGQQPDAEVERTRDAGEQRPAEVGGIDPRGFHEAGIIARRARKSMHVAWTSVPNSRRLWTEVQATLTRRDGARFSARRNFRARLARRFRATRRVCR